MDPDLPDADHELEPDRFEHEHPLWRQDNVVLLSVGVDIGTATTHVAFSRLHLRHSATSLSRRFEVVERETLFESAVAFTPYDVERNIDAASLARILDDSYDAAGVRPTDVDTGAVLITGDALRSVNAERISEAVSRHAGVFVCAAAGHHMEAELAAHGSGAVRLSSDRGATVLNIDIGGGTAKFAVIADGVVCRTAALHIGTRHLVVEDGRVASLEESGPLGRAGSGWFQRGDPVGDAQVDDAGAWLADTVLDVALGRNLDRAAAWWLTEPVGDTTEVDALVFSGGVGEYVYGDVEQFGDLGRSIGKALRGRLGAPEFPLPLWRAEECIRATVLGAAGYTVQLSGLTTYISGGFELPCRDVAVVRPSYEPDRCDHAPTVEEAIRRRLETADWLRADHVLAVALAWSGRADYPRLRRLAEGVCSGLDTRFANGAPTVLIIETDIAMTMGRLLAEELDVTAPLLVLDGLRLNDFEYVDVGRPEGPSRAMPVVVKSLVF